MNNEITIYNQKINFSVFRKDSLSDEQKARVREYAKLQKLKTDLQDQLEKLKKIIELADATDCKKYLWENQKKEVLPIFDLTDEYLNNIVNWHKRNYREVPKEISKEHILRFGIVTDEQNTDEEFIESSSSESYNCEEEECRWLDCICKRNY